MRNRFDRLSGMLSQGKADRRQPGSRLPPQRSEDRRGGGCACSPRHGTVYTTPCRSLHSGRDDNMASHSAGSGRQNCCRRARRTGDSREADCLRSEARTAEAAAAPAAPSTGRPQPVTLDYSTGTVRKSADGKSRRTRLSRNFSVSSAIVESASSGYLLNTRECKTIPLLFIASRLSKV